MAWTKSDTELAVDVTFADPPSAPRLLRDPTRLPVLRAPRPTSWPPPLPLDRIPIPPPSSVTAFAPLRATNAPFAPVESRSGVRPAPPFSSAPLGAPSPWPAPTLLGGPPALAPTRAGAPREGEGWPASTRAHPLSAPPPLRQPEVAVSPFARSGRAPPHVSTMRAAVAPPASFIYPAPPRVPTFHSAPPPKLPDGSAQAALSPAEGAVFARRRGVSGVLMRGIPLVLVSLIAGFVVRDRLPADAVSRTHAAIGLSRGWVARHIMGRGRGATSTGAGYEAPRTLPPYVSLPSLTAESTAHAARAAPSPAPAQSAQASDAPRTTATAPPLIEFSSLPIAPPTRAPRPGAARVNQAIGGGPSVVPRPAPRRSPSAAAAKADGAAQPPPAEASPPATRTRAIRPSQPGSLDDMIRQAVETEQHTKS
jgi:hypothetical protein